MSVSAFFAYLLAGAGRVGVNYGQVANNLPNPTQVAQFLVSQGLGKVKIYDANVSIIQAFANTQVEMVIGLPNEQLDLMATNTSEAYNWVQANVANYYPATQIVGIAVGNEVPSMAPNLSASLLPAMTNLHSALVNLKLDSVVKLSTPLAMSIMSNSYPPSAGQFNASSTPILQPIFNFLSQTGSYVMLNVYPFFAYSSNPAQVPLNYALFLPSQVVTDPTTGLQYNSLFDAQLDSFYSAMTALSSEFTNLPVVVTETGWPSAGDPSELGASIENAADYNGNLVKAILSGSGTPLKPNASIEAYLFALFNENEKPGPTSERNYGLFFPTMEPVYYLNFSSGDTSGSDTSNPLDASPQPSAIPGAGPDTSPSPPAGSENEPTTQDSPSYCIAKSDASTSSLQSALDYACGPGGADCQPLQPGQSCFDPNTLWAHASYAFNSFYQKNQKKTGSCFFGGNAFVNTTSPSKLPDPISRLPSFLQ